MSASSAPRVLLVAHHANPTLTSESLIGWRWAEQLDRRVELTLVTHVRNRDAIEAAGTLRGRVRYVDTESLARRINRLNDLLFACRGSVNRLLLEALGQRAFDRAAVRFAKELVAQGEVDVIHRVSPISPRYPSGLGRLGVPFVIGPMNGGMGAPAGFESVARKERQRVLALRPLARLLDPLGRTLAGASSLLVANETTRATLPRRDRARAEVLCENAVEIDRYRPHFARRGSGLRLLYLGRLLPYKGVQYAIEAIQRLPAELGARLDVVGDGSYRRALEERVRGRYLRSRVRFLGQVAHEEVPGRMRACDVFVLPSIRESGGSVVLEAMAAGKPVIVADHGGPSETVPNTAGIRLPCNGEAALTDNLVRALAHLATNEERRERMGRAARAHVEQNYTWEAKADRAIRLYDELILRSRAKNAAWTMPPFHALSHG
ncbi:MAG: glycosyltransferase family 4 protein [Planctomycetota bacterium]